MKAFLASALLAPLTSWAQAQLLPRVVTPAVPTLQQALTGLANPRYLRLPAGTFLYRHLSDTASYHYTRPLPPGDWSLDVMRVINARWVAVRWRKGAASHTLGADTTTYYMPKAALNGAQTIIEI
jgi:hypothetical protein